MLNILLAYKWIFVDLKNKKQLLLYSIYFIFITVFCWHLKQPYIIIAVIPTIVAGVLSIIQNHKKNNLIYRFGTIFLSIIILAFSIFSWNIILDAMHANKNTARDSSSILSKQLAITYQISDTNDNYFSAFTNEVLRNPGKIIGIYLSNYCSLASLCKIESTDGVNYHSTSELDLLNTYENTAIGYATYNRTENIFQMSDDMHNRAADYATNVSSNVFRPFMKVLSNPTNIIFKLAILFCIPITIFLIIVKVKTHDKKHQSLFYLTFILLSTASFHLIFSAIALVIDRYAIEAFTPICLGFFGTIAYAKLAIKSKQNPKLLKTQPKEKHA